MVALVWLLIIALASLLIVRLGTTALTLTGLPRDTAEFQAYSAFFGVGFTTRESEQVVNHPVRRRITQHLILAGQVGLTSVIVPLVVTFVNVKSATEGAEQFGLIVGALAVLWLITSTRAFTALVDRSIKFALKRAGVFRQALDHEVLLRLYAGFTVSEVAIEVDHALAGQRLAQTALAQKGIVVLGIARADGTYVGAPRGDTLCDAGDVLTVYGRDRDVEALAADIASGSHRNIGDP
jgi:hypothetical protein